MPLHVYQVSGTGICFPFWLTYRIRCHCSTTMALPASSRTGMSRSFVCFMSSPFVKLMCVRAFNVAKRAAHQLTTLFPTRRHFDGRACRGASFPKPVAALRGKTQGFGHGWAAGAFIHRGVVLPQRSAALCQPGVRAPGWRFFGVHHG